MNLECVHFWCPRDHCMLANILRHAYKRQPQAVGGPARRYAWRRASAGGAHRALGDRSGDTAAPPLHHPADGGRHRRWPQVPDHHRCQRNRLYHAKWGGEVRTGDGLVRKRGVHLSRLWRCGLIWLMCVPAVPVECVVLFLEGWMYFTYSCSSCNLLMKLTRVCANLFGPSGILLSLYRVIYGIVCQYYSTQLASLSCIFLLIYLFFYHFGN